MKCPCEKGICQLVTFDDSGVSAVKPEYVEDFCIYTLNGANAAIFSRSLSGAIPDSHQRQNTCANRCALFCTSSTTCRKWHSCVCISSSICDTTTNSHTTTCKGKQSHRSGSQTQQ